MSIETNLNVRPYFDDYDPNKDYYKILFKPSTAVQVRELNQLQTLLQNQIEQFGNHILKSGTILTGCQFTFATSIPFVKIRDITSKGSAVDVNSYIGSFVKNSSNLVSKVIDAIPGFEAQDPNLNTLYLEYLNGGDTGNETSYDSGELTVYTNDHRLHGFEVINSSQAFTNNDTVVITSAIRVQNSVGGTEFANGTFEVDEIITQSETNAQAVIIGVNATADSTSLILRIKPLTNQLAIANSASWNFRNSLNIVSSNTVNEALVVGFVGNGAAARLETTITGSIRRLDLINPGVGYIIPPHVTVSSLSASQSQINTLNVAAENFLAKVTVATDIDSDVNGFAYGVSVSEGSIYQKGHFLRVNGGFTIVDKYANTPNDVSVGFATMESIVNNSIDDTLLDNAAGFLNQNAPGADRLRLRPILTVRNDDAEDENYLPIVKFSEGKHFLINSTTQYNQLGDELAVRTFENSGNFVLDTFNLSTKSTDRIANSDTSFTYVIDPGHAYIGGYRVRTERSFARTVDKATETRVIQNTSSDINYGNYVRVRNFAGVMPFDTASQISLRITAANYITAMNGATITPTGSEIGKARVRSVILESGTPGTPSAVYRIYLFDIKMNSGRNFKNVRSFYWGGSLRGIADAILENVANENSPIAVLHDRQKNSLLIDTSYPLKQISNVRFVYRTSKSAVPFTGSDIIQVAADSGAEWPYAGSLSTSQRQEVIVTPESNIIGPTYTGTFVSRTLITDSNVSRLTGSGTQFLSEIAAGDHILVSDGANSAIVYVDAVANNTSLTFGPNNALNDVTGGTISRAYPANVPINTVNKSGLDISVVGSNLVLDMPWTPVTGGNVNVVYNQRTTTSNPVLKATNRKAFVKIQANTNIAGVTGPWCVGHSDVIRLRSVTLNGTSATNDFYIDHNQNENYYDVGYLYKKSASTLTIPADAELVVEFDVLTHDNEGVKYINSYNIDDGLTLSEMDTNGLVMNTMEIPQVAGRNGVYHDLRECIDFRPLTSNTVALAFTSVAAPVNPAEPSESTRFSNNSKKFPAPESDIFYDMEYYLPRTDTILVNSDSEFQFLIGRELNQNTRESKNQLVLYKATIPPYPSLPFSLSTDMSEIVRTNVMNETFFNYKLNKFTIKTQRIDRQVQGYTMAQIAQLESRIAALEYYANLSQLEDGVRTRVIPSSLDSTLERFKFGFFVDNFLDYTFTDVSNPEQNSTIYAYVLQPGRTLFNLNFKLDDGFDSLVDNNIVRFPYTRKRLLSQTVATTGPVIIPPAPQPEQPPIAPPEPVVETVCQSLTSRSTRRGNSVISLANPADVFEQFTITLSSIAEADGKNVDVFFNNNRGQTRLAVYQSATKPIAGGNPGLLIYNSPTIPWQSLTAEDRSQLQQTAPWSVASWLGSASYTRTPSSPDTSINWEHRQGKFSFPYNLSRGRFITFRIYKATSDFIYRVCYPADAFVDPIYNFYEPPAPPQEIGPVSAPAPIQCTLNNTFGDWVCDAAGNAKRRLVGFAGTCVVYPAGSREARDICAPPAPQPVSPPPVVVVSPPPPPPVNTPDAGTTTIVNLAPGIGGDVAISTAPNGDVMFTATAPNALGLPINNAVDSVTLFSALNAANAYLN